MSTNFDGDMIQFQENLPLLSLRDMVIYPYMIIPLFVGREASLAAVEDSLNNHNRLIFLSGQKDIFAEHSTPEEIYGIGTVAIIMRMKKLNDGRVKILVQGLFKAKIESFLASGPHYKVNLSQLQDLPLADRGPQSFSLLKDIRQKLEQLLNLGKMITPDLLMILDDIEDPGRCADLIAANLNLHMKEGQTLLECLDPITRLEQLSLILDKEIEILKLQKNLSNIKKDSFSSLKHDFSSSPHTEESLIEDEFKELKDKIKQAKMPENTEKEALKQLGRLEKMHPDSSESNILRTYLDWMVDLPWSLQSDESLDLENASKILNEDHHDLEKVKERILEYLAVRQLKGAKMKGPILCFSGPPGVGKTSLGKSIARATGRSFIRISLGGVKDEAEIRGHRRTYVGSMPGRIIQAMKQAKTNNPVILLDEIDKMGADYKGDPSSALLEVLDPEQNNSFRDHYLNVSFDLSNVMFLATANVLDQIPGPLRDRMEVISLPGYGLEEKILISKKHLIPKQVEENGIPEDKIIIQDDALKKVIRNFTRESGLRNLERQIGALCRKVAIKIARGDLSTTVIKGDTVEQYLGAALVSKEFDRRKDEVGVATGLAWTASGGELLMIEAELMKGKGITLTGQLGDVMKESAHTAVGHLRSKSELYGINPDLFEMNEIHLHFPAGAIPKDGPSAGITIASSILSILTNVPVRKDVAMTGEISLKGKVLPVGGIKEKVLEAMRSNIYELILPEENRKDVAEISPEYQKKLTFHFVRDFEEVVKIALSGTKKPKKLSAVSSPSAA